MWTPLKRCIFLSNNKDLSNKYKNQNKKLVTVIQKPVVWDYTAFVSKVVNIAVMNVPVKNVWINLNMEKLGSSWKENKNLLTLKLLRKSILKEKMIKWSIQEVVSAGVKIIDVLKDIVSVLKMELNVHPYVNARHVKTIK